MTSIDDTMVIWYKIIDDCLEQSENYPDPYDWVIDCELDFENHKEINFINKKDKLEKEESEELFMIPCCHCGFRFERDTRMHDNAICDDDDNWFCQDCHEFCPKEESEEE